MKKKILPILIPILGKAVFGATACFVLAVLMAPRLHHSHGNERLAAAKGDLAALRRAVEAYHGNHAQYPGSLQDLLPTLPEAGTNDPWGFPYRYARPGKFPPGTFDVWSVGPDGIEGTDDDIYR